MNSYNLRYGAGLADSGQSDPDGLGESGTIGIATISNAIGEVSEDFAEGAQAAGFYAAAYTVGAGIQGIAAGTKIISYRGTDNLGSIPNSPDVLNGYGIATGSPLGEQARLAA